MVIYTGVYHPYRAAAGASGDPPHRAAAGAPGCRLRHPSAGEVNAGRRHHQEMVVSCDFNGILMGF